VTVAQREDVGREIAISAEAERPPLLARLNAKGFRLLMVADAIVLFTTMAGIVTAYIRYDSPSGRLRLTAPVENYAVAFGVFTLIFIATYYFGGAYERELRLGQRPALPQMASLTFGAWLIVALMLLVARRNFIPLGALPIVLVVVTLGVSATRLLSRVMRRRRFGPPKVLLLGAPDEINLAQSHLEGDFSEATVVGHAADVSHLLTLVEQSDATEVLLLSGRMLDEVYPEPLQTLENRGVGVLQRVMARDTLLGLENVREIAGMPFVALRTHTLPVSRARFKRSIETVVLLLTAPLTIPLGGLTALYVRLFAGSPVLFWQDRVGREGKPFRMVKFRTMYPDAEEGLGAVLSKHGDPRIIPACRVLRSTRLDELPQFWNVLRGEMSIVGPRPERPELTAQFEELIPGYSRRHEIPPGITGLAQIHGRYHTDPEYKLGHDLQYLVNWSPVLDLQILLRTVWVVLARRL
jgi:exopolysaccharide biosynthesis polyprenyl glycosylphosphotransferase